MTDLFTDARDFVQQTVTARLHGHENDVTPAIEDMDHDDTTMAFLVAVDLVCYVHMSWARTLGMDDDRAIGAWQQMLLDVAEWREEVGN